MIPTRSTSSSDIRQSSTKAMSQPSSLATTNSPPPISLLFVCLGNICRSPMAEAVFRSLTPSHPLIATIDSAGTGAYHTGSSPDPRTMSTLADNGIRDYDHAARKVRASDFADFDYIVAMDRDNLEDLRRLRGRVRGKKGEGEEEGRMGRVVLFGDFGAEGEEVGDPYYGARNGFKIAFEQCTRFSRGFIGEVLDKVER